MCRHIGSSAALGRQNKGDKQNLDFWEKNIPWTFRDDQSKPSYEERRKMRYELQEYMHSVIGCQNYQGKQVLEVGSGSGIDAVEFARHGAIVTAVDARENGTLATQETLREAGFEGLGLD
jgi:2-polyprenyl-3-methyl-5-hydroxy-6-metoxy-1,4-benzoquinol methylase